MVYGRGKKCIVVFSYSYSNGGDILIKRRRDVPRFIKRFGELAEWDGEKHYIVLGDVTLMRYEDGMFTYYRKNELFWDIREIEIEPGELQEFVWGLRKKMNKKVVDQLTTRPQI